ncbi:MAG: hypothetical protein NVSMB19_20830 [Vulcanimicrobiaceae bacterium]
MTKHIAFAGTLVAIGTLAACGGGSTSLAPGPLSGPVGAPNVGPSAPATQIPQATNQVVSVALPTTAIGRVTDPIFGLIGGYTQSVYSQVLGFPPGMQIVIRNAESARPHTLGDLNSKGFPAGAGALSAVATGSATFAAGWQSGNLNPGQIVGPVTLTAGTYYIGCLYHYTSDTMRDVLVVAAAATPGPQATQQPGAPTPRPTNAPGGGGY